MNERIQELDDQAREYGLSINDLSYETFHANFAELIIRECIEISETHAKGLESQPTDKLLEMYDNGIVCGIYEATAVIKEHFGVEE